jgi:hypothetical protein
MTMETSGMMTAMDAAALTAVTGGEPASRSAAATGSAPFPSTDWFQRLADLMNANRARQEQLGYVDCVAGFRVVDAAGGARTFEVTFEEFAAIDVREADASDARADFVLEATLATWREMIENIAHGKGRPDLTHTLNYLSHPGTPVRLVSHDPLKADLYFRYNQSLQEFVNASASFATAFPGA